MTQVSHFDVKNTINPLYFDKYKGMHTACINFKNLLSVRELKILLKTWFQIKKVNFKKYSGAHVRSCRFRKLHCFSNALLRPRILVEKEEPKLPRSKKLEKVTNEHVHCARIYARQNLNN